MEHKKKKKILYVLGFPVDGIEYYYWRRRRRKTGGKKMGKICAKNTFHVVIGRVHYDKL